MSFKLHIAFTPALGLTVVLGGMVWGSVATSAEEVGDGHLQTAAYDVLIVPREGRTARSRIWTDRGWANLPTERVAPNAARPRAPYGRQSYTPRTPTRFWAEQPTYGPSPRYDRRRAPDWRGWRDNAATDPGAYGWRQRTPSRTY